MTATPASLATAYVGTSGWSYPSWRPGFYPAGARPEEFLRLYSERLATVELNTTGYRIPSHEQFARWAEQTPAGFRFAPKLVGNRPRMLAEFSERVLAVGERLGPVRVQLVSARDDGLLELVLGSLDPAIELAFDLPHPSWDGIEPRLAEAGAVRVGDYAADAPFRYLRFRDPPYSDDDLTSFAAAIRRLAADGVVVYAYFRHEDEPHAPRYAERLLDLVSTPSRAG